MTAIIHWSHREPPADGHKPDPDVKGIRGKYQNCRACGQPLAKSIEIKESTRRSS